MVEVGIFLVGAIIFIGFFSLYFFERTKVPDVIFLMLLGVLITSGFHILDAQVFVSLAPFFGAVALIVILFDGGLNLKLAKVLGELSKATLFTLAVFLLTVILVGVGMHVVFGWDLMWGLIMGAVIGGTSSPIVMPVVAKLSVNEETKTLLSLESALTDSLCIVTAIALIEIIVSQTVDVSRVSGDIVGGFSTAAVVGILAGLFWLGVLKQFHGKRFGYMLTLGVVFLVYAIATFLKGNGAIASLVFGLMIGNAQMFANVLKLGNKFEIEESIKNFQTEITFFVRTFFFVYLGILFNPDSVTFMVAAMALTVLMGLVVARWAVVKLFERFEERFSRYHSLLVGLMPRGLAAAVLASLPLSSGIAIPSFAEIVFIIIILTNLLATVAAFVFERESRANPKARPRIVQAKVKPRG